MKLPGILLVLTVISISACRKNIQAGVNIQADGFVIDSVKNKKLANVTVYLISGHESGFQNVYYYGAVDSAVTNTDGSFSIKYTADGKSYDYALSLTNMDPNAPNHFNFNAVMPDRMHPFYSFDFKSQLSDIAISARELNFMKIHLSVLSNPYDTLLVFVNPSYGLDQMEYDIYGNNIDTTILTRSLPEGQNFVSYEIITNQLRDSIMFREITDTITTNLSDTFVIQKNISSAYDIPLAVLPH
jgi:hypothetical protein